MQYETLNLRFDDGVAWLRLARPVAGNAINQRMLLELASACEAIDEADGVVVVLLDAEGDDFCAGSDQGGSEEIAARQIKPGEQELVDVFAPLAELPMPVVGALQGLVSRAGLELALCCDLRIASDDARFRMADPSEEQMHLAGATLRLPRIVGRGAAAAMLQAGTELDAAAALRCGLVSRVVSRPELPAEAERLARTIAARGPLALRYAKEAVRRGIELPLEQALRLEADLSVILQSTHDRAEGVRAFFEKRPPEFKGN